MEGVVLREAQPDALLPKVLLQEQVLDPKALALLLPRLAQPAALPPGPRLAAVETESTEESQ